MSNEFMGKALSETSEAVEAKEVAVDLEAEALEQIPEEGETVEDTNAEIPESIADVLQLTDAEKAAYNNIGQSIDDMPVEGRVIGYKKGGCTDRQIPIYD